MKIIDKKSKKDYYDYLIGIYGEDPMIVLDRRECVNMNDILGWNFPNQEENKRINLFIGGYKIEGFLAGIKSPHYNGGKIYYGENLKDIDDYNSLEENYRKAQLKSKFNYRGKYLHNKGSLKWEFEKYNVNRNETSFINMNDRDSSQCIFDITIKKDTQNYNEKYNCPILYYFGTIGGKEKMGLYPNLLELNLNSFITPENVYRMVSDWISEQRTKSENKIDVRTDIEKLEGKGFDKKISFRNIK